MVIAGHSNVCVYLNPHITVYFLFEKKNLNIKRIPAVKYLVGIKKKQKKTDKHNYYDVSQSLSNYKRRIYIILII